MQLLLLVKQPLLGLPGWECQYSWPESQASTPGGSLQDSWKKVLPIFDIIYLMTSKANFERKTYLAENKSNWIGLHQKPQIKPIELDRLE